MRVADQLRHINERINEACNRSVEAPKMLPSSRLQNTYQLKGLKRPLMPVLQVWEKTGMPSLSISRKSSKAARSGTLSAVFSPER